MANSFHKPIDTQQNLTKFLNTGFTLGIDIIFFIKARKP